MPFPKDVPPSGRIEILLVTTLTWSILTWFAPWSVGWRDSGEFILSAFFLDIPHPAGFPTYSVLANVFALLFPGPVPWRVHLFSCACSVVLLSQIYRLSEALTPVEFRTSILSRAFVVLAICSLLTVEPFLRSAITAEVYALNACFLLIIVRLLFSFLSSGDVRLLYSAAFVGGVSLGNHVVALLSALWIAGLWLISGSIPRKAFTPSLIFFLFGIAVYAYLPIRALANPPLNTGDPRTLSRVFAQMTDMRDQELRVKAQDESAQKQLTGPVMQLFVDGQRLLGELPLAVAVLGLIGFFAGVVSQPKIYLSLSGIIFPTLLFFSGWDPDPWIAAITTIVALSVVGYTATILKITRHRAIQMCLTAASCLAIAASTLLSTRESFDALKSHSSFQLPGEAAQTILQSTPRNGILVTEPSWFITRYLQALEGYRSDVSLIYLPSLLFPTYFAPAHLFVGKSDLLSAESSMPSEPNLSNLFKLVSGAAPVATIQIEPIQLVVEPLKEVLLLEDDGNIRLRQGVPGNVSSNFAAARASLITKLISHSNALSGTLRLDTLNYASVLFAQMFDSLETGWGTSLACDFGIHLCVSGTECPPNIAQAVNGRCG
jgi:hypothetical protein